MNSNLQTKLQEVFGSNNIAYILKDNGYFSITGYKVMQNHNSFGLLKCAKLMYNGKIKLVYLLENYKPLSNAVSRLGVNEINIVLCNLIQRVLEIKSNGFFIAENIELDTNKIFIDLSDFSVHIIYYPLSNGATGKMTNFENEFRIALINLFNSYPIFNAPQFQMLCSELSNGSMSLDLIAKNLIRSNGNNNYNSDLQINGIQQPVKVQPVNQPVYVQPVNVPPVNIQPVLTLTAINSPVQCFVNVDKPEFVIGKNEKVVDGVINYNPAISRVHCKILFNQGKYFIQDVGSANGTFINDVRLNPQQVVEIYSGDCLKLANSEFRITF